MKEYSNYKKVNLNGWVKFPHIGISLKIDMFFKKK